MASPRTGARGLSGGLAPLKNVTRRPRSQRRKAPVQRHAPMTLTGSPPDSNLPPYGHVLLDLLGGGSTLSVRGDAAEEAWRVLEPVLAAWRDGLVPLEEYPAEAVAAIVALR